MTNRHSNCETYEPLISALIDGELEPSEQNELKSHLQNCAMCKQRMIVFERVDAAVEILSHDSAASTPHDPNLHLPASIPFAMHPPSKAPLRANRLMIWRLIPLAAAATLLICLGIAAWPNPKSVNAELISSAQIVEPMKELYLLNLQQQREQELMVRTLGMDLRSMKLEINLLDPESDRRANLAAQIDAMIEKVNLYESNFVESTD